MTLNQYYKSINELLAPHGMGIMLCVAIKLYQKDWSVTRAAGTFLNLSEKLKADLASI